MQRLRRQLPFLRSMLQEANRFKRQDLLQHANADQINAVSELVLNFLKNKIPVTPPILAKLQPYKKVLRDLGRRRREKTSCVVSPTKRTRVVSRSSSRVMSMRSLTLPTWMLQEAHRETWKEECSYWKHKYHLLYRETMHILRSRLCESCRALEDGGTLPRL